MIYFGFAVADGMFASPEFHGGYKDQRSHMTIRRYEWITDEIVPQLRHWAWEGMIESCLNPSHKATINAMQSRFGLAITIPDTPPKVRLGQGDRLFIMAVRGLPRLTDRHEYTQEEIDAAEFVFIEWSVDKLESV